MSNGAPSLRVRDELELLLERDLLGPRDGAAEELPPGVIPAEYYLLGRLVPRVVAGAVPPEGAAAEDGAGVVFSDPDLLDREVIADAQDEEDVESQAATRSGTMAASAVGLMFMVPAGVDAVTVTARWGRYAPRKSVQHTTEQGRARSVWGRTAVERDVVIRLDAAPEVPVTVDAETEGVVLDVAVRERTDRAAYRVVHVSLINGLPNLGSTPDMNRLYQVQLEVTALDGNAPIFLGHNDPEVMHPPSVADPERRRLEMLHRSTRKFATGQQCAVDAEVRPGEQRAWRLRTTCFPAADVAQVVPGDAGSMPGVVLDMNRLGSPELAADDLVAALRPLATGYRAWLRSQQDRLTTDPEIASYAPAGTHAVEEAFAVADRLDRAVDLLRDNGLAREAFRFANQAMALQRVRGELVRQRQRRPTSP